MSSYYQKREAARIKIQSGQFSMRENVLGQMVEEKPYHVMYSSGFPGYFTYMVLCNYGDLDDERKLTYWGFDYYDDVEPNSRYYREAPADYEHCLSSLELTAWLEKYYGDLNEVEDYQYLINIVETAYNSTGESYWHEPRNKELALSWLNNKIDQLRKTPTADGLGLKWNGPRTEFVELLHALFNAGALTVTAKGGRAAAAERLGKALGIEGTTPYSTVLNDIRMRNSDRETPLLDRLKEYFTL